MAMSFNGLWRLSVVKLPDKAYTYPGLHVFGRHEEGGLFEWQVPNIEADQYVLADDAVVTREAALFLIAQRSRWAEHQTVVNALLPPGGVALRERLAAALEDVEPCCLDNTEDVGRVLEALLGALRPTDATRALIARFNTGHPMPRSQLEALVRCLIKEFCE